jgi:hypothetical protein
MLHRMERISQASAAVWVRVTVLRRRLRAGSLSRRGLCTISRFWTLLFDLYRYKPTNSMLNFEFLCKAPGGRGSGRGKVADRAVLKADAASLRKAHSGQSSAWRLHRAKHRRFRDGRGVQRRVQVRYSAAKVPPRRPSQAKASTSRARPPCATVRSGQDTRMVSVSKPSRAVWRGSRRQSCTARRRALG